LGFSCDRQIGFGDIYPFVTCWFNCAARHAPFPGCDPRSGDIDCDGTYGQHAFEDTDPFVALTMQCACGGSGPAPVQCQ
jgi:hypothetical protein